MIARRPGPRHPAITAERIVAGLLIAIIGFFLVVSLQLFDTTTVYLLFVVATVIVVRSVPVEPGAWLGIRLARRALVVVISLITLDFVTMRSADPNVGGLALLIVLALCDVALGRATRRITSAEARVLDERQEALRNRAHRIAYVILALSVGVIALVADVATPETEQWLADAIRGGGALIGFIQLLFFLPAMVVAWLEPDRISYDDAPQAVRGFRGQLASAMVAVCLLAPMILSAALAVAPMRTSAVSRVEPAVTAGDSCRYFEAHKNVGVGMGAEIPIAAVVCWNGTTAYEEWGLNASDCLPRRTEFVIDATVACRRVTEPDGTLRFTYHTVVRSAVLPFIGRDVVMTLALSKDGKVVQFP